jgi:hypothetical protein
MVKKIEEDTPIPEEDTESKRMRIRKEMLDRLEIDDVSDKEKAPGWKSKLWNVAKASSYVVPTLVAGTAVGYANSMGDKLDNQDKQLDSVPRAILNTLDKGAVWLGPALTLIPGYGQMIGAGLTVYGMARKALATPVLGSAMKYAFDRARGAREKTWTEWYNDALENDPLLRHRGFVE